ncbi:MAG: signal peptide peptidase SppA, partial [bacterium]|nr:signal peptide peptidase SppA [bacterium]
AIVLRVDSPGGSGFASDEMWRELMLCKSDEDTKKPVVISFSDVAASGGYYIALPGETIVSEEGTITGSIGVLSVRPVIDSTLKKIGTNYEEIRFSKHAGMFNMFRRHSPEERKIVEKMIKEFYKQFVQKVADSREMAWSSVDSVGNGRVWTGKQGLDRKLVDTLGGLDLAIEIARAKAKIPSSIKPDVVSYPKPMDWNLVMELQNASMMALPEPIRYAVKTSGKLSEAKPGEMQVLAPEWIFDGIDEALDTSLSR